MVKQKEPVNHSSVNCGTWMKSDTWKADRSLKQQSLSVVMHDGSEWPTHPNETYPLTQQVTRIDEDWSYFSTRFVQT